MSNTKTPAADIYPGATIDKADDNRTDKALEKERTKTLNNNPRGIKRPE